MTRIALIALLAATAAAEFPPITNSQNPADSPPTPPQAVELFTVPPGFSVTLFAGEPDVHQPIAFDFDDRGRLWVAECYSYTGRGFTDEFNDRIVILEDTDDDGRFDRRAVFYDQAKRLSGLTIGFDGVWVLMNGQLAHLPDRNRDDKPDGPPNALLDGFDTGPVGHNIVSGLLWGPDGWLYGRHGIQATSYVAAPGTPDDLRTSLNCSIWRYHPTRKVFEVVTHGTTNPWGLDYDDHGQMFFTNNVIGHLWHVIPGAHFRRMYGVDFNPHLYELIDQHADHYHWDSTKSWTDSRDTSGKHGELGGGHSHCGGMIYLGDNWPEEYRNQLFMNNTHGRRVNRDALLRHGCGYIGRHQPDMLFANNIWFRGIDLKYGPDGAVYISDWVDFGECHDNDGVHRTSGRVYKVAYGKPNPPTIGDLRALSDEQLGEIQTHRNDWYVRRARRLLQERAATGSDMSNVHAAIKRLFADNPDVPRKLRAMWALYATNGVDDAWLTEQLAHENEHVRLWAIRLLADDRQVSDQAASRMASMAGSDESGLVRLFLASVMQRMTAAHRWPIAEHLATRTEDAHDHNQPLMLWYGLEPVVMGDPSRAVALAYRSEMPLVRRLIARRVTSEIDAYPQPVNELVERLAQPHAWPVRRDVLGGMTDALRGRLKASAPAGWAQVHAAMRQSPDRAVIDAADALAVVFGDGLAVEQLLSVARDGGASPDARANAIAALAERRIDGLVPLLHKLTADRALNDAAVRALRAYDHPDTPGHILNHYTQFDRPTRRAAIDTLASRAAWAAKLLDAVNAGRISRQDVTAFHARQMAAFEDPAIDARLASLWGQVRPTPDDLKNRIAQMRAMLTDAALRDADPAAGRALYQQLCAACHRMYGEGGTIGPDLTGANRDNLDYLLENIIDPNATLPNDFRTTIIRLKDGQVIVGMVVERTERTITVQTQEPRITVDLRQVAEEQSIATSLMPTGLLDPLNDQQVRDLFAYLRSMR